MKPTTPEQFANCYGTFIADLVIVAKVLPAVNTWLQTSLPDVSSAYKLNSALFSAYTASISSFPRTRRIDTKEPDRSDYAYSTTVNRAWTAITIDLKNALTCAEVDPNEITKIMTAFSKLKPKTVK